MTKQYQGTSAPYSADVLDVHDAQMIAAIEFGTNTLRPGQGVGDPFWCTGNGPITAAVNARLAMLQLTETVIPVA